MPFFYNLILAIKQNEVNHYACLNLQKSHRQRLSATNSLKRLNEEIRRRTRVISILPNEEPCIGLIGALLFGQS